MLRLAPDPDPDSPGFASWAVGGLRHGHRTLSPPLTGALRRRDLAARRASGSFYLQQVKLKLKRVTAASKFKLKRGFRNREGLNSSQGGEAQYQSMSQS
jgi:hypothetical protein